MTDDQEKRLTEIERVIKKLIEDQERRFLEAEYALIGITRVVADSIFALGIDSAKFDQQLQLHQTNFEKQAMPVAAGILGTVRQLVNDPRRKQTREGLQQLVKGQVKGSA